MVVEAKIIEVLIKVGIDDSKKVSIRALLSKVEDTYNNTNDVDINKKTIARALIGEIDIRM